MLCCANALPRREPEIISGRRAFFMLSMEALRAKSTSSSRATSSGATPPTLQDQHSDPAILFEGRERAALRAGEGIVGRGEDLKILHVATGDVVVVNHQADAEAVAGFRRRGVFLGAF